MGSQESLRGIGVSATHIFTLYCLKLLEVQRVQPVYKRYCTDPGGRSTRPGKVAVLASPLGMINGSAIANVATTGTITIPNEKVGYKADFRGGRSGSFHRGQFTPPIMGAEFCYGGIWEISYTKVMIALFPAFYYLNMASVHLRRRMRP